MEFDVTEAERLNDALIMQLGGIKSKLNNIQQKYNNIGAQIAANQRKIDNLKVLDT